MFTRHFYRFDEVRAALLYAILKGRAVETAFWTQELLDSDLSVPLWTILTEAWLWFSLATDIHWITDRDASNPHLAAYRLAIGPKDNSLWAVLCINPQEMPDTLCSNVPKTMPYTKPCLEKYLHIALHQRKGLAACWAALRLDQDAAKQVTPLPLPLDLPRPLLICASILWACSRGAPEFRPPMNQEVLSHIAKWSTKLGRRSRRLYEIPVECLYGLTARGCSSQTMSTLGELRQIHELLMDPSADDDAKEAFYQATFPDDIPDEWSLKDQMMSHGQGVLRTGERLSLAKLGRIWFQAESRYAWGFYEWTGEDRIIENRQREDRIIENRQHEDRFVDNGPLDFQQIADNLNVCSEDIVTALLEPVRKLLIVE